MSSVHQGSVKVTSRVHQLFEGPSRVHQLFKGPPRVHQGSIKAPYIKGPSRVYPLFKGPSRVHQGPTNCSRVHQWSITGPPRLHQWSSQDFCSWEPPRPPLVDLLPVGEERPRGKYVEPTTISIDTSRLQVVSLHALQSGVLPPSPLPAQLSTTSLAILSSFSLTCDSCGELFKQRSNVQGLYNPQHGFDAGSL